MPQLDEHDDFAALDFSAHQSGSDDDSHEDSSALDFSAADDSDEESDVEALSEYAPTEGEEDENELEAIDAAAEGAEEENEEGEEDGLQQFTVTNPPETVSVSALIDGRTQRVTLSPKAKGLTESELAEEIIVLSGLARRKGLAGQHTYLMETAPETEGLQELTEMGVDSTEVVRALAETALKLPTPEQADAEQAEVFAARYAPDK